MDTKSDGVKIKVTKNNCQFLVWSAKDVIVLRKKWRIIGNFIGVRDTLPLYLSPLETFVLLKEDAIEIEVVLESSSIDSEIVVQEAKTKYEEKLRKEEEKHRTNIIQEKESIINKNRDIIIAKHRSRTQLKDGEPEETDEEIIEKTVRREREKEHPLPLLFLKDSPDITFTKTVNISPDECFTPKSEMEKLRFFVFQDIWSKGFFITSGLNFAADFLVYERDPFVCHAKYMIICREENDVCETSLESVTFGRLSVSVNKQLLFTCFKNRNNPEEGILYRQLKWEGKSGVE